MKVFENVLEMIGDTPMVRVNVIDTGPCELYLKLESQNPGGSIKDRIGLKMIEAAEQSGQLRPGATLVEGTTAPANSWRVAVSSSVNGSRSEAMRRSRP